MFIGKEVCWPRGRVCHCPTLLRPSFHRLLVAENLQWLKKRFDNLGIGPRMTDLRKPVGGNKSGTDVSIRTCHKAQEAAQKVKDKERRAAEKAHGFARDFTEHVGILSGNNAVLISSSYPYICIHFFKHMKQSEFTDSTSKVTAYVSGTSGSDDDRAVGWAGCKLGQALGARLRWKSWSQRS